MEVLLAAARRHVRCVVFASSSAVYGIPEALPCREDMRPAPESPYGASKLAAEGYLHSLGAHLGVETVALRYFNVYGPGQDPKSDYAAVIPLFICALLGGRQPVINGDGAITRDFIYVDDVVNANKRASSVLGISGETMNVASGEQVSLLGLLDAIATATGSTAEPRYGPPRPGDIKHSAADVSLARALLGQGASVPFVEGISRTVEWYRSDRAGAD